AGRPATTGREQTTMDTTGTHDKGRLLAAQHARLGRDFRRRLAGRGWLPVADLAARIQATDADHRVDLEDSRPDSRPGMARPKAPRGRQRLVSELIALLPADGSCELRDGPGGQEIRLRDAPHAATATDAVGQPAHGGPPPQDAAGASVSVSDTLPGTP